MRVAWLECATGVSGDMTLAALIDAGVDRNAIETAIQSLKLPDVRLRVETVVKGGFRSTQVFVDHPKQHAHRHMSDIRGILDQSDLTDQQRQIANRLFLTIAQAEACVHGSTVEKVHFHEVGAVDSIVDIVGVAVGFDLLGAEQIVCNPVPTGRGFINIDHGICPIPAPGTAEILKGIPLADVPIEAELTTPTGAAIVSCLADRFGPMPAMTIEQIGCGCGSMTFNQRANILRLFVGETITDANTELVSLLETNLDDVSPETIGYTCELLRQAGALDVYVTPVQMKKDRPAFIMSVLTTPLNIDRMETILFDETGTLGIRRQQLERSTQHRDIVTVTTPWGDVQGKRSWKTGQDTRFAPEFEDCAKMAAANGVPLRDVYRAAESAFLKLTDSGRLPEPQAFGTTPPADDHHHDHSHDHDHHH